MIHKIIALATVLFLVGCAVQGPVEAPVEIHDIDIHRAAYWQSVEVDSNGNQFINSVMEDWIISGTFNRDSLLAEIYRKEAAEKERKN